MLGSQPGLLGEHMRLCDLLDGGHNQNISDAFEKRGFGRFFATEVYYRSADPSTYLISKALDEVFLTHTPVRYGLIRSTQLSGPAGTQIKRPFQAILGSPNTALVRIFCGALRDTQR